MPSIFRPYAAEKYMRGNDYSKTCLYNLFKNFSSIWNCAKNFKQLYILKKLHGFVKLISKCDTGYVL